MKTRLAQFLVLALWTSITMPTLEIVNKTKDKVTVSITQRDLNPSPHFEMMFPETSKVLSPNETWAPETLPGAALAGMRASAMQEGQAPYGSHS